MYPSVGSPGNAMLQVGIALVLEDRFSNQAREASSSIRRLLNEAKVATNANLSAVRSIASWGTAAGTVALTGMAKAIDYGSSYVDTMALVDSMTTKTTVSMDQLSAQALRLGADTMFTSQQVADAMKYFAMAGFNSQEISNSIGAAVNMAGSLNWELGGVGGTADILHNVLRMFQANSSEAGGYADIMVKCAISSNMNLGQLAESLKYAGTTATNLGVGIKEVVAEIGVMGNAGLQGSLAGTALANMYRYLAKSIGDPKFKGHKVLASLGISGSEFLDAKGGMKDISQMFTLLKGKLDQMGPVARTNALSAIFGVRGERAATTILRNLDRYQFIMDRLDKSPGTSAELMAKRMNNIFGQIKKMTSSFQNTMISFTMAAIPVVIPVLKLATGILNAIYKVFTHPVGKWIAGLMLITTTLFTVRMAVLGLKATWLLLTNDSTISFNNMIRVMRAGWNKVGISAMEYAAIERGIITQRAAGGMASPKGARGSYILGTYGKEIFKSGGVPAEGGNIRGIMSKKGNVIFMQNTGKGVTGWTRVGKTLASEAVGGAEATITATEGKAMLNIGSKLLGFGATFGKTLFSLLGGWWGIGITAGMTVLPMIYDAITDTKDNTKDTTNAVNKQSEEQRQRWADSMKDNSQGMSQAQRDIALTNAIRDLASVISGKNPANIHINVDGKKQMQQLIDLNNSHQLIQVGAKSGIE